MRSYVNGGIAKGNATQLRMCFINVGTMRVDEQEKSLKYSKEDALISVVYNSHAGGVTPQG